MGEVKNKKFFYFVLCTLYVILGFGLVSSASIFDELHLNVQTVDGSGNVISGTFNFVFNISTSDDCNNVIYSNSATLTTDSRGIISHYLSSASMDYGQQYYLCYYRNGALIDVAKIARSPYAFRAKYVNVSGIQVDSNLDLGTYNLSAAYFFGDGSGLTNLNINALDLSGYFNKTDILGFGYYNLTSFNIDDYYLKSNPYGYYNLTSLNVSSINYWLKNGSNLYYNDGNVGIGTSSPSSPPGFGKVLEISSGTFGGSLALTSTATGGSTFSIGSEVVGGTSVLSFYNGSSPKMVLTSSGNVGIGTTSPNKKFVIQDAVNTLSIGDYSSTYYGPQISTNTDTIVLPRTLWFGDSTAKFTGSGGVFTLQGDNDVVFNYWNGSAYVTGLKVNKAANQVQVLTSKGLYVSGDVGIGTTSPQNKLNVIGAVNATSFIGDGSGLTGISGSQIVNDLGWINSSDVSGLNANNTNYLDEYDSSFFMPLNTSVYGDFDFNGGWMGGGVSIVDGNIYAQSGYFYDINSLSVTHLEVNGSLIPDLDNLFDLGNSSRRWRNANFGGAVTAGSFVGDGSGLTNLNVNASAVNYWSKSGSNVYYNDGNVGIGTTTPGVKLVVAGGTDTPYNDGTLKVVGDIALNSPNNLNPGLNRWVLRVRPNNTEGAFDIYDARYSLSRLTILDGGNVGIGTTTPGAKLDVVGKIRSSVASPNEAYNAWIDTQYSPSQVMRIGVGDHVMISTGDNDYFWGNILEFRTADTVRMIINAGNVGIGTMTPGTKLEVAGNINATGGDICITGGNCLSTVGSGTIGGSGTTNYVPKFTASATLGNSIIYDNGTNVGIGTSSPKTRLDVSSAASDITTIRATYDANNYQEFAHNRINMVGSNTWSFQRAGVTKMSIDETGNVGIGTTSPNALLHLLIDGGQPEIKLMRSTGEYGASIWNNVDGSSNDYLAFGVGHGTAPNLNEKMRITDDGNVGIGTTTPGAKLDVKGKLFVDNSGTYSSYSWAGGVMQTNSIEILDRVGGSTSDGVYPTLTFHDYGNGGAQFSMEGATTTLHLGSGQSGSAGTLTGAGSYFSKLKVWGNMETTGILQQGAQTAYPNAMWSAAGTTTGAVQIYLPGTVANYGMVHMVIDVYEYSGNSVTTYIVGGHNWNGAWYSYGARTLGVSNKPIRLGVKNNQYVVVIGDSTSSWSYGHVVLRSITNGGYYPSTMNLGGTYAVVQDASAESYTWISANLNDPYVTTGQVNSAVTDVWVNTTGDTMSGNLVFNQGASTRNVGIVGTYSPNSLAAIWSMGAAYQLGADGTAGALYGLSYSYEPDYGGAGNNPGAIAGLGHQMQWRAAGATQTAIGTGVWTTGTMTGSRFISNVATGTAPLTVASTTMVSNLNSQYASTLSVISAHAQINLNSMGLGRAYTYSSPGDWVNGPSGMGYGSVYNLGGSDSSSLSLQIAADINHNSASSTRSLWFRTGNNLGFQNDWKEVYHSGNLASPTNGTGTTNYVSKWTGTTTQGNSIIYDDGTSVGIGTTSPLSKLQVGANTFTGAHGMYEASRVGFSNNGALTGAMLASTYDDPTYPGYGMVFVQGPSVSNYNVWSISPDGPAKGDSLNFIYQGNATNIHTQTPKVVFDGNGNVGIGTSSPGVKLDVAGDIRATSSSNGNLYLGTYGKINYTASTDTMQFDINYPTSKWSFTKQGVSQLFIGTNGNVGIGITTPNMPLQIYRDGGMDTALSFWQGGVASSYLGHKASDSNLYLTNGYYGDTIGTDAKSITLTRDGNVGIGTTTPTSKLHVYTGNVDGLRVQSSNSAYIEIGGTSVSRWRFANDYYVGNSLELLYGAAGANPTVSRLIVDGNGNVGIGTTAPGAKLHVAGSSTYGDENGPLMVTDANTPTKKVSIGYDTNYDAGFISALHSGVSWKNLVLQGVGGNVGIGTPTPGSKLTVAGSVNAYEYLINGTAISLSSLDYFHSGSDFADGTLVRTNIPATASDGASFVIEISGKSYSSTNAPFKVVAQGYLYSNTIIHASGLSYGGEFVSYIKMFEDGGYLCFWWPRYSYWNSFNVHVRDAGGSSANRVTSITNSVELTGNKKIQVDLYKAWNSYNDGASSGLDADLLDGQHGSYYAAASSLGNYLPLAGGTMTGSVLMSGDTYTTYGPNSGWGSYLRVGGNGRTVSGENWASIATTNGNLHMDAGVNRAIYLNYYAGNGVTFGNGAQATAAYMSSAGLLSFQIAGENIQAYGIRGQFTNEYLHVYNKLGVGDPTGWGNSQSITPAYGLSTYGGAHLATNQGNVGIGTTSPGNKLTVVGSNSASIPTLGVNSGIFGMIGGSGAYGLIGGVLGSGNTFLQSQRVDGTATAYNLLLQPSGGNVGIGTTSPGTTLQIGDYFGISKGDATYMGAIGFNRNPTTGAIYSGASAAHQIHNYLGKLTFQTYNSGGTLLSSSVIDSTGNVGIGTTNPGYKLDVSGVVNLNSGAFGDPSYESGYRLKLRNVGGTYNDAGFGIESDGGKMWFNNVAGGGYYFNDGTNGIKMTIAGTTGNVGIGTTTPGEKLEVNGNVKTDSIKAQASKDLVINGTSGTGNVVIVIG